MSRANVPSAVGQTQVIHQQLEGRHEVEAIDDRSGTGDDASACGLLEQLLEFLELLVGQVDDAAENPVQAEVQERNLGLLNSYIQVTPVSEPGESEP